METLLSRVIWKGFTTENELTQLLFLIHLLKFLFLFKYEPIRSTVDKSQGCGEYKRLSLLASLLIPTNIAQILLYT